MRNHPSHWACLARKKQAQISLYFQVHFLFTEQRVGAGLMIVSNLVISS